ncbi:uncharacterized protein [Penaeus vannamei]|uniref:uncharacterized protein n=1 Tax=Penaeus vannamei TaxID=6689 RepID=UPI00387F9916
MMAAPTNRLDSLHCCQEICLKVNDQFYCEIDDDNLSLESVLRKYEIATTTKFVHYWTSGDYGKSAEEILNKAKSGCSSKRILWKTANGTASDIPQIHVGACTLECHQGENRYLKIKARRLEKKEQEKDNEYGYSSKNTRRFLKQPSKKQNCPAQT